MDHLIGQRFSLVSKSEIRYVGTLHEINPEQSTIALEDVVSFGTEGRQVDNYIPPSQQRFEYIVFRGSDVKDISIESEEQESKQPPQPPSDPAILNSSRPAPARQPSRGPPQAPPGNRDESPFPPHAFPHQPPQGFGGYYPPPLPPAQFGRGYGPPPLPPGGFGPGPGYSPYGPPPPGYFGPPGQGFPPQNRFPQPPNPAPIGPPGLRQPPPSQQPSQPAQSSAPKQTPELPVEKTASESGSKTSTPAPVAAQTQPPKQTGAPQPTPETAQPPASKHLPSQPKSNRITPAMPFAVNQKTFTPPVPIQAPTQPAAPKSVAAPSQNQMEDASRQAREAVAAAMAKLNPPGPKAAAQPSSNVDSLAESVGQMSTGPPSHRGRGAYRGGRGVRSSSGGQRQKMEIPQSDFDFEASNAKFNKEDLIKEAIASGSPLTETPENSLSAGGVEGHLNGSEGDARKESLSSNPVSGYNKSSSFFDNISSEAKDREDNHDGRANARAMRSQEFQRNVATFGQGNVDSGYRGRGRGGYRGGRGRGGNDRGGNFRGNYRGRGRGSSVPAEGTTVSQN